MYPHTSIIFLGFLVSGSPLTCRASSTSSLYQFSPLQCLSLFSFLFFFQSVRFFRSFVELSDLVLCDLVALSPQCTSRRYWWW